MLDEAIKNQLKNYLTNVKLAFTISATLASDVKSLELKQLLEEIANSCSLINLDFDGSSKRIPSFKLKREQFELEFAGIPMGHEFSSLVLALLQMGGHPPKVDNDTLAQIKAIKDELLFETYFSQSCQNCPDVVQALNLMATVNSHIKHVAIDGALFADEVEERGVMSVPTVFLNGKPFAQGRMEITNILGKLDSNADSKIAENMNSQQLFDTLIVGSGPAGVASAIYLARKGLNIAIAGERLGGQVLDTMEINNFIGNSHTEGPKLARDLENHLRDYPITIFNNVIANSLDYFNSSHTVSFTNGGKLQAKTLIVATGAKWREISVPGEDEYKTRGVCFCPHCDGPLFKGKKVAVIGGGNSGIEAAIDLAGICAYVTVLEFADKCKADQILLDKALTLNNIKIITNAKTTKVLGDGNKVNSLEYQNLLDNKIYQLDLAGIFVQIGLLPNTAWVGNNLELNKFNEVIINEKGQTSKAGIFAAGDCATTPYKQIVIATGSGATAALSAFDYLITN